MISTARRIFFKAFPRLVKVVLLGYITIKANQLANFKLIHSNYFGKDVFYGCPAEVRSVHQLR